MAKNNKKEEKPEDVLSKKDLKKIHKLKAQIPYHEGRGNADEVTKIKEQVEGIWAKARAAVE